MSTSPIEIDQYPGNCPELLAENTHLRQKLAEQVAINRGILQVLGNERLTAADRIIGIKAALGQDYCFSRREADEAPMSLGWIADQAGMSRQRVTDFRKKIIGLETKKRMVERLADEEIFRARQELTITPPDDPTDPNQRPKYETTVIFERIHTPTETLEALARVSVGRTKPGGNRDKKITIPAVCAHCGGDHFTVTCDDCGDERRVSASPDDAPRNGDTGGLRHNGAPIGLDTPDINHLPPPIGMHHNGATLEPDGDQLPDELAVYARMNEAPDMRSAALAAAAGGIPVFSCHTVDLEGACSCGSTTCDAGKHPWGVTNGFQGATTDREQIERWWNMHPTANIGIWAGAAGWVVIDVDEEGLEDWRDLAERLQLPATLTARSGSGGYHHVYQALEGVTIGNGTGNLPPGVHVRGAGGYIIAAPSLHQSGQCYRWCDIRPIVPLPDALRRILVPAPPPPRPPLSPAQRGTFYTTGTPIYEGNRNRELARVAGGMVSHGASGPHLEDLIAESNQNRCKPPLPDAEARKIARSIEAKERRKGGSGL